jgi:hypothetical protein
METEPTIIEMGPWDREASDTDPATTWGTMSDQAGEHLRHLIMHRPDDDDLTIVLYPKRCALCEELAVAYLGRVEPEHAS